MITGDDLFYLLGVLNSNVFDFYNSLVSSGLSDKAKRGFKIFIENFPIPETQDTVSERIGKLSHQIVDIMKSPSIETNKDLQNKVKKALDQINQLVYKAYGLSEDEIALIERETQK